MAAAKDIVREYQDGPSDAAENRTVEQAYRKGFVEEARRIVRDWARSPGPPPPPDPEPVSMREILAKRRCDPLVEAEAAWQLRSRVRERFKVYGPGDAGRKTYVLGFRPGHAAAAARLRGRHHAMAFVTNIWEELETSDVDIFDPRLLCPWLRAVEMWASAPIRPHRIVPPPRPLEVVSMEELEVPISAPPPRPWRANLVMPPLPPPPPPSSPPARTLQLTRADQIEVRPPQWLLRGMLAFGQMISDAEAGADFRTILCYDISRFSRGGTNETGYYLHRLRLAGVDAIFCAEGIPEGDEGELLQGVKSWQARQYSVKLSRDCIRGSVSSVKAKRSAQGGQPPYGYDRQHQTPAGQVLRTLRWLPDGRKQEFDAAGKLVRVLTADENPGKAKSDIVRLVPSAPERVATVKRIFQMYLSGTGFWTIAATLNAEGVPSPKAKAWNAQQVKHIIGNPAYCGTVAWNRRQTGAIFRVTGDGQHVARKAVGKTWNAEEDWITAENVHTPIISPDAYAKAREERLARRFVGGLGKSTHRYMLSGLIRCGHCKTNFYGWTRHWGNGVTRQYYVDGAYHRKGKAACQSSSIPAAPLDAWVLGKVRQVLLGDDAGREAAINAFVKAVLARQEGVSEAARLEKEVEEVGKRMKTLAKMLSETALDDMPELQQTLLDLRAKRKAAEARLAQVRGSGEQRWTAPHLRRWAEEQLDAMEKALGSKPGSVQLCRALAAYVDHIVIEPATKTGVLYMMPDAMACLEKALSSRVKHSEEVHNIHRAQHAGMPEAGHAINSGVWGGTPRSPGRVIHRTARRGNAAASAHARSICCGEEETQRSRRWSCCAATAGSARGCHIPLHQPSQMYEQ